MPACQLAWALRLPSAKIGDQEKEHPGRTPWCWGGRPMTSPAAALAALLLLALLLATWIHPLSAQASPSCQCGNQSVPFPFSLQGGICNRNTSNDSLLDAFNLLCDPELGDGPLLQTPTGLYQVLEFRPTSLVLNSSWRVQTPAICSGNTRSNTSFELATTSPYVVAAGNTFVTRGCNSTGSYKSDKDAVFTSCTVGECGSASGTPPACNGVPCCSIPFPAGVKSFELASSGRGGCGLRSTVVMTGGDWLGDGFSVEWAIQDGANCSEAAASESYACAQSAVCKDADWLDGYTCACGSESLAGDGYKDGTGCTGRRRKHRFAV